MILCMHTVNQVCPEIYINWVQLPIQTQSIGLQEKAEKLIHTKHSTASLIRLSLKKDENLRGKIQMPLRDQIVFAPHSKPAKHSLLQDPYFLQDP